MSLDVLVDPAIFAYGRCGMTRYYAAVCEGLEAAGHRLSVPLDVSNSDFMSGRFGHFVGDRLVVGELEATLPSVAARAVRRVASGISRRRYRAALRRGAHDVVLITAPDFEDGFLAHLGDTPFVMVVHDTMRCVLGPDGLFDVVGANIDRLAYLARRAARVVCISESTRRDLLALSGMAPDRCRVIPTGQLLAAAPREPVAPLPERFVLFVGDRAGRKNFRLLAEAAGPVLAARPEVAIVCAGRPLSPWERDHLARFGLENRVVTGDFDDHELAGLYRRAACLAYPSLYEGFGLPVLEAMAAGCPVLTSPVSSLPEVAGDAAAFADPTDAADVGRALAGLLDSAALRARLGEAGRARSALFSLAGMRSRFDEVLVEAASAPTERALVGATRV